MALTWMSWRFFRPDPDKNELKKTSLQVVITTSENSTGLQHGKFAACSTALQHVVTFPANVQHNFLISFLMISVEWLN
jgi:hypothetical protein